VKGRALRLEARRLEGWNDRSREGKKVRRLEGREAGKIEGWKAGKKEGEKAGSWIAWSNRLHIRLGRRARRNREITLDAPVSSG